MKFAKALTLGFFSALIATAAFAQEERGRVLIRHLGAYVNSDDFMNDRGQKAEDLNNNYWNFYYKFVYNVADLQKNICFSGNAEKAMAAIAKTTGYIGDEETPTIQNLSYSQESDSIRFAVLNRRADRSVDINAPVQIEAVRCGQTRTEPVLVDSLKSMKPTLMSRLFDRETQFTLTRNPDYRQVTTAQVLLHNKSCVVLSKDSSAERFKAGMSLRAKLMVRSTFEENGMPSGYVTARLYEGQTFASSFLTLQCAVPTTATVQDLETALEGLFKIED